ncbi:MAG: hypothetical protein ACI4NJ_01140 [Cellvibrio sp.]
MTKRSPETNVEEHRKDAPETYYTADYRFTSMDDKTLENLITIFNSDEDPVIAILIYKVFANKIASGTEFDPRLLFNFVRYPFIQIALHGKEVSADVVFGLKRGKGKHAREDNLERDFRMVAHYFQARWAGNNKENSVAIAADVAGCSERTVRRVVKYYERLAVITPDNIEHFLADPLPR